MIILSVGLQKSGSAWFYNMTNDLLIAASYQDARLIRQKFNLHATLKHANCVLSGSTLRQSLILIPHFLGNTFAVKSHTPPSKTVQLLIKMRIIKVTFIYRDPRDIVLAAFERGQKKRQQGKTGSFTDLDTIEKSIFFTAKQLNLLYKWTEFPKVFVTRYEDLIERPVNILKNLTDFLNLQISPDTLQKIVATYQPENLSNLGDKKGVLHFNQGVVGRFRDNLTLHELDLCQQYFGDYLEAMGYSQT